MALRGIVVIQWLKFTLDKHKQAVSISPFQFQRAISTCNYAISHDFEILIWINKLDVLTKVLKSVRESHLAQLPWQQRVSTYSANCLCYSGLCTEGAKEGVAGE